jgi:hypothetical protein
LAQPDQGFTVCFAEFAKTFLQREETPFFQIPTPVRNAVFGKKQSCTGQSGCAVFTSRPVMHLGGTVPFCGTTDFARRVALVDKHLLDVADEANQNKKKQQN